MNKKTKSLVIAGSVFTISTTVGQVASINQIWLIAVVAIPNVLAWLYVGYIHFLMPYPSLSGRQYQTINNLLPEDSQVEHKHIETLPELMNIWQQDEIEYKEANIDFDLLRDWWDKNKKGLFIRTKGNKIEGSIGIWSITESFFNDILRYTKNDTQLRPRDIISHEEESNAQFWYISGWFIRTNEDILHQFLGEAFQSLLIRLHDHTGSINISIIPMTTLETILLERLHFKKISTNRNGQLPVYCYSKPSLDHLRQITALFLRADSGIEAFERSESSR
ncbi:hypothetical protein [Pararcticibacter amylolyticus]|uniref:Uncharacterized protein n=1 Tax=Pararcticibacter amylolyticus TaxID=2173175 RepID=A0A2U2P9G2_9SPHI|nr:hypothetical protein [Pararcticibacter amylolyticus]PWG78013.1 hypothetical protein DDR33_24425 [Pararcticibacter amylolyticus]